MTRFSTRAVHAGRTPDGDTGAFLTPIHQSTTFAQADLGAHKGHTYSRASNPTVAALESRLVALEGGIGAVAFASGMAAIDAVLRRLGPGDHVVVGDVVYGGTVRLLREVYARNGVDVTFADASDPASVERELRPRTRLVLVESPSNPTLKLVDLQAIGSIARSYEVPLAVDNTFLTPYAQRVFEFGADLAIHSTTKSIEGHNATVGGAVVVRDDPAWLDWLGLVRKTAGTIQSPFEAWLTLRGLKTLPLRVSTQARTALHIATWLESQPQIDRVIYPFLASHPQRALAGRQQLNGGALVSFDLGSLSSVRRFVRALRVVTLAENLGAAESLITHPATMTHAAYSREERAALGITDGLLRLSVGLEDPEDLVEDLARGLAAAAQGGRCE